MKKNFFWFHPDTFRKEDSMELTAFRIVDISFSYVLYNKNQS